MPAWRTRAPQIRPVTLNCCTKRFTADAMVIGVPVEPELEQPHWSEQVPDWSDWTA
jgi:hypothetical protein